MQSMKYVMKVLNRSRLVCTLASRGQLLILNDKRLNANILSFTGSRVLRLADSQIRNVMPIRILIMVIRALPLQVREFGIAQQVTCGIQEIVLTNLNGIFK